MVLVKCHYCKEKDTDKADMIKEKQGYIHPKCREFINRENEEWDELYQYVKDLHGIPEGIPLPSLPVSRLKALRDGYDIIGGKREQKKWRQGASFKLMKDAYKIKEDDIKWFIHNVLKGECDAAAISKCITLMLKSLSAAWKQEQDKIKREQEKESLIEELIQKSEEREYNYKSKKRDGISGYL